MRDNENPAVAAVAVPLARRAQRLRATGIAAEPPGVISFGSGDAFPAVLPDLREVGEIALGEYREETMQYAPRGGLPALKRWICELHARDGSVVRPDQVLITNGAKHGLDLVCRLLLDEGDAVTVTAPTYFTAIPIFRAYGVEFIEIGQDAEGLDAAELEAVLLDRRKAGKRLPKIVYDVPDFHNPTGISMSRARREKLVALASQYGFVVVEDSPYRRIRFEDGVVEPTLKSLDRTDSVYLLGTFSKLMAPGLRIGWVVAPPEAIGRMAQLKSDGGTCPLTQRMIVEFCARGLLDAHVARLCATYREHRDRMLAALRRDLPQAKVQTPSGGYYLWLELPAGVDSEALASRAMQLGVSILPGARFYPSAAEAGTRFIDAARRHVRLAHTFAASDEIDAGVAKLAAAYAELR